MPYQLHWLAPPLVDELALDTTELALEETLLNDEPRDELLNTLDELLIALEVDELASEALDDEFCPVE